MCGIVGYVGARPAAPLLINGLSQLEYRGYDSSGIAIIDGDGIHVRRAVGKLANLRAALTAEPIAGTVGIGHTRWATHGAPSTRNAHPHSSMDGCFAVIHNGIVENYVALRQSLMDEGVIFRSDTDSEVIVQLIARYAANGAGGDLTEAVRKAAARLQGAHAIVALSLRQPDRLVAVRIGHAGGVALGLGDGEYFVASDVPALLEHTRRLVYLEDGQMATVTADGWEVSRLDRAPVQASVHTVDWDSTAAERGTYAHFMRKEIHEQPRCLTDTMRGRVDFASGTVALGDSGLDAATARGLTRLVTVACGTSYYSGLIGKFYFEALARLHTEVDYASEYRYRDPLADGQTAVLAITQSGETVDTLAAMAEARGKQARLMSIVNTVGSQAMRMAETSLTMNAGPEIGVASTKAFTTSILDQLLLAVQLGRQRGAVSVEAEQTIVADLARLPVLVGRALETEEAVRALAQRLYEYEDFLYLGRGIQYAIALEGALKLKEISYIHAEGYPAGEMKHGPIALIDERVPVVAICLRDSLYDKMLSQVEQVKARGGRVIALATEGDTLIAEKADEVIYLPETPTLLAPMVAVVPLQLLAYYVALARGCDVDQPRNLAKSVTVE